MSKNRRLSALGDRLETRSRRPKTDGRIGAALVPGWRPVGGGERSRTVDLLLAKQALSQLSYTPDPGIMYQESGVRSRAGRNRYLIPEY